MADFQELGIKIEAIDNASEKLQKVVDLLENIKKLSNGGTSANTSSVTTNINKQATALRSVASVYGKLKVAAEGATNAEIALTNAQNRQTMAAARYEDAQNKKAAALENLARAQEKYNQTKADYDLYTTGGDNTPGSNKRYNALVGFGWNDVTAPKKLESAQNALAAATNAVTTATQQERNAYASLVNSQNSVASATNRVTQEQKKQEEQSKKTTKSTAKSIITMASAVAVVRRLSKALFSAVEESGAFVENLNLFAVTFGDTYQETLDWALDFADNLGVASNEIIRFTGLFKQLSDSIGIASDMGTEMSQVLTQLGYDLASFYNISTESAFEKLQAGIFSGQTKPLRSLGLDVTQQTLDNLLKTNEAFKDLGVTSSKALLQSDKAMLRLIVVLQNAQNSFGDMQRTINTLSNQIKVFQGSLANLKLAIGDLFSEPFRKALVYINAFLIAITDIIRLFKPIKKESETAGAGMEQFADDTEDALNASTGGGNLDFDKFRVLGDSDSQTSITEAITEELQKQIDAYNEQLSSMNSVKNEAIEIAEAIKSWFVVTDKDGKFVEWTKQAQNLFNVIKLIGATISASILGGMLNSIVLGLTKMGSVLKTIASPLGIVISLIAYGYVSNENFRNGINKLLSTLLKLAESVLPAIANVLNAIYNAISPLLDVIVQIVNIITPIITYIVELISNIIQLLDNLGLLESAVYAVVIIFSVWAAIKIGTFLGNLAAQLPNIISLIKQLSTSVVKVVKDFSTFIKSLDMSKIGIAALGTGIGLLIGKALDSLPADIRGIAGALMVLVGAAFAAAYAVGALKSAWTLGAAAAGIAAGIYAITSAINSSKSSASSSVSGFVNGGITDANFIMTHENGVREWVGRQGNSTAVVNDTQMSTVMSQSVRDGVLEALSYGTGSNENINITVQTNLDGQKIYESTRRIARKNGEKFAKV